MTIRRLRTWGGTYRWGLRVGSRRSLSDGLNWTCIRGLGKTKIGRSLGVVILEAKACGSRGE